MSLQQYLFQILQQYLFHFDHLIQEQVGDSLRQYILSVQAPHYEEVTLCSSTSFQF